jgi:hypothetical protein
MLFPFGKGPDAMGLQLPMEVGSLDLQSFRRPCNIPLIFLQVHQDIVPL